MERVTLQTNLLELVERHPDLKRVFEKRGVPWLDITCMDKTRNTVEDATAICGLISEEIVDELNQALENLGQAGVTETDEPAGKPEKGGEQTI
ncbi:MAG: hypothetical protein KGJ80_16425 [Chloroflexota bacterium]|nr:hypothetical protein [Chloroflexota bacterium]